MDPYKVITYIAVAAVVTLLILGGVGFYAGYSAGTSFVGDFKATDTETGEAKAALAEIARLNQKIAELQKALSEKAGQAEASREAEARAQESARLSQELSQTQAALTEQKAELLACRRKLAALEAGTVTTHEERPAASQAEAEETATAPRSEAETGPKKTGDSKESIGRVLFYDQFQLGRQGSKAFDEVDLEFGLQTVASKSASLKINGQQVNMTTQEGKRILHKGVTCELILLSTNLGAQEARFSIACRR